MKLYSLKRENPECNICSFSFNRSSTLIGMTTTNGDLEIYQLVKAAIQHKTKPADHRFRGYGYSWILNRFDVDIDSEEDKSFSEMSENEEIQESNTNCSFELCGLQSLFGNFVNLFISQPLECIKAGME